MARNVLLLFGAAAIGWAMLCLFAGSVLPEWLGLSGVEHGELYIESVAVNVGLWTAVGVLGILGGMFQRLRLPAALTFLVVAGGIAGGRVLALVHGAKPGLFTVIALAIEVGLVVAATAAFLSERTRISREAKELHKAEKAALDAALAAEHSTSAEEAAPPPPTSAT